jgi:hypothetical protein
MSVGETWVGLSQDAERGKDATEDAGTRLLGGAEPEQVFERAAITPIIAHATEAVELALAHESAVDEPATGGIVPDALVQVGREIKPFGPALNRDGVLHWSLRIR